MEEDKILTTKQLADYINLNEKTIIKMAQKGELPGKKIANQWRFSLSVINEYLQDNIIKSKNYNLSNLIKSEDNIIPFSRLTDQSYIKMDLSSEKISEVLLELALIAENAGLSPSAKTLYKKLLDREEMLSTAIGNGMAIPHPRNPDDNLFKKQSIIIARSKNGVDFKSPDGGKVYFFLMPCAPDVVLHLKLLTKISRLLHVEGIISRFMSAETKDDIIRILLEAERIQLKT
ncbi:MAG: PTS sugar transporter subunit IIA [Candidatus Firestonebacteria bacterium]|nr:PTS sugar transporter subunit IIA [Candidatus Firestonebacteria bacterium]